MGIRASTREPPPPISKASTKTNHPSKTCHLDRSAAKWRDLQLAGTPPKVPGPHPISKSSAKLSRHPHRNLSSPQTQSKTPNRLQTLAINLSETWHSYPFQLATIELGVTPIRVPRSSPRPNILPNRTTPAANLLSKSTDRQKHHLTPILPIFWGFIYLTP